MANDEFGGNTVPMEDTERDLRPTWFQTFCAMIVMGFAASVVSGALVMIEAVPAVRLGVMFVIMPAFLLLVTEYLGVFRGNRAALVIAMLLLLIVVVFSSVLLYSLYRQLDRSPNIPGLLPAGITLVLCVMSIASLRANWLQHESLKRLQQQGHLPKRGNTFSIQEIMAAILLLAFMIGPAAIRVGQNESMYIHDASPQELPFTVSPTAQNINMSRNRDGSIQAVWTADAAELQKWFDAQERRADVDGFLSVDKPRINTGVRIPRPPESANGTYDDDIVPEGRIVFWDIEDRHIHITWSVIPDSGVAKVYYRESRRE